MSSHFRNERSPDDYKRDREFQLSGKLVFVLVLLALVLIGLLVWIAVGAPKPS